MWASGSASKIFVEDLGMRVACHVFCFSMRDNITLNISVGMSIVEVKDPRLHFVSVNPF